MPNPTVTTPVTNVGPGFLYYAPIGTTIPTMTVAASVFSVAWGTPWVWIGMTDGGSTWHYNITTAAVEAAESIPALAYETTGAAASVDFSLKSYTASNLAIALNGATKTVTGSTTTTLTKVTPPTVGEETRFMIGWESLDASVRKVAYQVINSGDIAEAFVKAPNATVIPFTAQCELSISNTVPFETWFAGEARA